MLFIFQKICICTTYSERGTYYFTLKDKNDSVLITPSIHKHDLYLLLIDNPPEHITYHNLDTKRSSSSISPAVKLVSSNSYNITNSGTSPMRMILWITEPDFCRYPTYAKGNVNFAAEYSLGATNICTFLYYKDFSYKQTVKPDKSSMDAIVLYGDGKYSSSRSGKVTNNFAVFKINKTIYYSYSFNVWATNAKDKLDDCQVGDFATLTPFGQIKALTGFSDFNCSADNSMPHWKIALIIVSVILGIAIPALMYYLCRKFKWCSTNKLISAEGYQRPMLYQESYSDPIYQQQPYTQYQNDKYSVF